MVVNHEAFELDPTGKMIAFYSGRDTVWILSDLFCAKKQRAEKLQWKSVKVVSYKEFDYAVAVDNYTMNQHGSRVYIFGGCNISEKRQVSNQMYTLQPIFDPTTYYWNVGTWRLRTRHYTPFKDIKWNKRNGPPGGFVRKVIIFDKKFAPPPRSDHASCVVYDDIYYYGGMGDNKEILDDLWVFNCYSWKFTKIEHSMGLMPPPLFNHVLFSNNKEIFIHGGYTTRRSNEQRCNRRMYKYSIEKKKWVAICPTEDSFQMPLAEHKAIQVNVNQVILIGGVTNETSNADEDKNDRKILNDKVILVKGLVSNEKDVDLCEFIENQRKKKVYVDFRIIVKRGERKKNNEDSNEDTEIHAHKCILGSRLEFFKKYFGDEKENGGGGGDHIVVKGYSHESVLSLVKFLYTNNLKIVENDNIVDLLALSRDWGCEDLITPIVSSTKINLLDSHLLFEKLKLDFSNLFKEQWCPDLSIVCQRDGNSIIMGHKVILTRSKFIYATLHSGMMEEIENKLVFDKLSAKGLNQILHYLYTDEIRGINHETCIECHIFSIIFKLPIVSKICRELIIKLISEENVLVILRLFDLYQDKMISQKCVNFIVNDAFETKYKNNEMFSDLPQDVQNVVKLASAKKRERDIKLKRKKNQRLGKKNKK